MKVGEAPSGFRHRAFPGRGHRKALKAEPDAHLVDLVWKGVTYSIRDLCDVTGVALSRIIADVIIGGLSVEVVVAKVHSRYKQYTYKGEPILSMS